MYLQGELVILHSWLETPSHEVFIIFITVFMSYWVYLSICIIFHGILNHLSQLASKLVETSQVG